MASITLSDSLRKSLKQLQCKLQNLQGDWLLGGSCGLLLQHVSLSSEPRDLDIYTDHRFVEHIATLLRPFAVDQPHYSETSRYRSYLSHYIIEGVTVELVGEFVVECQGSTYRVQVSELMKKHQVHVQMDDISLGMMPLAHEFVFNILRDREDRYVAIAEKMVSHPDTTFPAFYDIVQRNQFSEFHMNKMMDVFPKMEREMIIKRIMAR